MPLLKRVRVMAAKIESTVGTDASLSGSDGAFNAWNVDIQADIPMDEREGQGGFNRLASVCGPRKGTLTFTTGMAWDGTATEPTWASVLLPACGWTDNGSGVFNPKSEDAGANVKTLTLGVFENGKIKKLTGAVGTFKINLVAGKMCTIDWEFQGVWQPVVDGAVISPTYPTATELRFAAATASSWNSVAMILSTATIDAGNEIVMREDARTEAGFISGLITDRKPMITVNPEAVLVATQNREGSWLAGTEAALAITLDGPGTATLGISAPRAQIQSLKEGDRGKMITDEIEFSCNKNGTSQDQELTITFTAGS